MEPNTGEEGSGGGYNFSDLPPHACYYSGIHDPLTVAMCTYTQRWFCNSKGVNVRSHIIDHLIQVKHFEIKLHP